MKQDRDPFERDWNVVAAVAVLSSFAPTEVRTTDGEALEADALARLLEICTVV
jgi:hypothetical protein